MISRLSDVLDGALRASGLEATSLIWQIAEGWEEIVGPRVAARAAPTRLRNGELLVAAPDAVWRQELTLLGPQIAAGVNRRVGKDVVERIRLVAGPARPPAPARRRRRLRPSGPSVPPAREATPTPADRVGDPPRAASVAAALEALSRARSERLTADRAPERPRPARRRSRVP
jgi:hypothetical protein